MRYDEPRHVWIVCPSRTSERASPRHRAFLIRQKRDDAVTIIFKLVTGYMSYDEQGTCHMRRRIHGLPHGPSLPPPRPSIIPPSKSPLCPPGQAIGDRLGACHVGGAKTCHPSRLSWGTNVGSFDAALGGAASTAFGGGRYVGPPPVPPSDENEVRRRERPPAPPA